MDESKMEQGVSQVDSRFVFDFGDANSSDKASVVRSKHSVTEQRRMSKINERQVFDEMSVREVSWNTMDVPPQQVKPKGRAAGTKKAPAKKKKDVEVDEDMEPLRARLAAYNLDSSTDNSTGGNVVCSLSWRNQSLAARTCSGRRCGCYCFGDTVISMLAVELWLKREDLQPVFSFKFRGAYNMIAMLPKEQLERGVICSSAGNHAQGVALTAKRLGCNAVIVMPITTPEIKGTVRMEIVRQIKDPVHAIFVPIGGGGLITGITAYVKRVSPKVKVIGVEPLDANSMAMSLHNGQRVMVDKIGGFADGVAVKVVGEENFRLCKELIDGVIFEELAEKRFQEKNMLGAKRLALRAKTLYPSLEGLPGFLGALDIYILRIRR
ncbi:hypothetical protein Droror1_Dr00003586 [Drosera rotundifolia]